LLIGSVSFVGGPGTAAAWAKEAQAIGLERAPEIAVAAATLAVVVGVIVSGPIHWLAHRAAEIARACRTNTGELGST
jgi:glutamate:Na+ symporter, ESS family